MKLTESVASTHQGVSGHRKIAAIVDSIAKSDQCCRMVTLPNEKMNALSSKMTCSAVIVRRVAVLDFSEFAAFLV